ncbi:MULTISPECIES: quinone-dependent dihydroorotate dehydrogenase [unclassified Rhizobium]|uniref:quinone-dependent dihydroorotate dehydrogenase n=1 Tax=unclassified Rhizobium TaxID=2613769 RepID=UPI001ADB5B6C|nr:MULTISPECIES: quinone-dependent dihydroorotate dehydrogenase [unclassified Rhizobium]MBO9097199.1 quinone-dependent dihydroorotate dehydrogenase [Rhizobium sp. L58/93]MBO9133950.1 quinone-dependent dihydroorotate dehydrogenase [Rhizobium sp. B209b/85]MBO9167437.1 quinone-dependent dihydroorotate dehydrogenase [Rhizobium sp. L245/93]MBO9183396.1 quinone-dependent dihydroorotate dehydrogenase [Rhizobium sp. E27B/91]QXZ83733.1 quinone-dependent dihydroorotate dehydrogenase [Rhizobium sp. K1/93
MIDLFKAVARRGLFLIDPETAHGLSITALKSGLVPACQLPADPRLRQTVAGLDFVNPLGMAAGFDKNAEVPEALLKLGFGFTEIGTVTPKPQPGNPKPRVFRLVEDEAVINRLGFNNEGHDAAYARLATIRNAGIIGVNIGANKDSVDRTADYVAGIRRFYSLAGYFTVNISSPNTPGLRDLQARESLSTLLSAVLAARDAEAAKANRKIPVFLKIAPDLTEEGMDDIADEALAHGLEGLIVSNTTLARNGLKDRSQAGEAGGLSGKPLFEPSTAVLARMRKRVGPSMAIIGVGGVSSAETALEKIRAGADLVQLYSSMVYEGPGLAGSILAGLSKLLDREQVTSIRELRDSRLDYWASWKV